MSVRVSRHRARPSPVIVGAAMVAVAFFALPLAGLLVRASWSRLADDLGSSEVRTALRLSLETSLAATVLAVAFGLPLAWLLARHEFRGRRGVRAVVTVPMVLPPVVGGVALLYAFGRRGIAGQWLDRALGITLPYTTVGAILAATFVAAPFFVLAAEAGLRQADRRFEDAAATLGARRWYTFRRVTLPAVMPSLTAGVALCWARALGEFGATITFAGNFPGRTQTMPLAVYLALQTQPERAIALSLVLLAVSIAVLVALRDRWLGGFTR